MLVYDRCELPAVSGYRLGVTRFGGDLAGVLPLVLGNFELAAAVVLRFRISVLHGDSGQFLGF